MDGASTGTSKSTLISQRTALVSRNSSFSTRRLIQPGCDTGSAAFACSCSRPSPAAASAWSNCGTGAGVGMPVFKHLAAAEIAARNQAADWPQWCLMVMGTHVSAKPGADAAADEVTALYQAEALGMVR